MEKTYSTISPIIQYVLKIIKNDNTEQQRLFIHTIKQNKMMHQHSHKYHIL